MTSGYCAYIYGTHTLANKIIINLTHANLVSWAFFLEECLRWLQLKKKLCHITINTLKTSLNLVPNAQVCVYLMVHITKLQLQTTFPKPLYIPHFTCIHRDPGRWKSWCLHRFVTRVITTYNWPWEKIGDDKYMLGLLLILISKSWGCPMWDWACLS